MAQWTQFEDRNPKPAECAICEALCPDAVDGTLTEPERRLFEHHVAHCPACAAEYEEAQRGAAWLGMLKGHTPEPPAALLQKILAETTGPQTAAQPSPAASTQPVAQLAPPVAVPAREPAPAWALSSVLRRAADIFRIETARATFQPRIAMTAAMAFVSIALTLNLTGIRLRNVRLADFTPSGIHRTVAEAGASAARNFENMRVVYQVESRVSELRGEGPLAEREDTSYTPPSSTTGQQQPAPAPRRKGL